MGGRYARIRPGGLHRRNAPLDQRLLLRLPRLVRVLRQFILRRPPTSQLRQAFLKRAARVAFSAWERDEFEAVTALFYSPDIRFGRGDQTTMMPPDVPAVVEGRNALASWVRAWNEAFAWTRYEVTELLDFGDGIVFTVLMRGEGKGSGARTEITLHHAMRLSEDAQIGWQRFYGERDDALRAAGVDPASVVPPPSGG